MEILLKSSRIRNLRKPKIISRPNHNVSRAEISKSALKVLYRLKKAGFQAFLVGGGVRDALLELNPKDFDIATNAHPEEIRKLFSNCRLIGRRFRLAHIHFGREIIEVATFRAAASQDDKYADMFVASTQPSTFKSVIDKLIVSPGFTTPSESPIKSSIK